MQLDLVEVGDLAQLFGDAHFVGAVALAEDFAGDGDVLVVVHREVAAVAGARAERRDTEHVGDELEALAVPGEDHGAGAGEALALP